MDQQNNKPVPTAQEIARLEAEAAAAISRGESPAQTQPAATEAAAPARADFVPYVDDVPEPAAPIAAPDAPGDGEGDEDDEEYIPGPWEKRIDALSPQQWKRWQILGGALLGLAAVACLFVFGQELSTYGLILAVILAVLVPRYLERAWRHPLATARVAMIVAMVVGLAAMAAVIYLRGGFASPQ